MIIGKNTFHSRPSAREFHQDRHLDFGQYLTDASPEMAVPLVGKIRSLFALRGEMEGKKT